MKKLSKNLVFDIIAAVVFIALAIITAIPAIGLGKKILDITVALLICAYIAFYLFDRFSSSPKKAKAYVLVEMILMALIALGLVFSQFKLINIAGACAIFGFALWIHGVFGIIESYIYRSTDRARFYPMWYLILNIAIASFGMYVFAKPFISDNVLIYVFAAVYALLGLLFVYLAIKAGKNKK
ncbi:MAG: hypothetical protein SOZ62_04680 [Eubacteriales bacterium]|nr:hypothetical protein [Eubacteriales bacterium]